MEFKSTAPLRKFYYGWVIVGLSILSLAFWFGLRTTFSVFFVALIDHFRWGRAEAAVSQSIALFVYMLMAPVIGTLVDRVGPRKIILPGIALTGLGLLLCTQIRTLFQFYFFYGLMVGIGITCLSIAPFTVVLSHWFEKKRGMANGLATVGMGIGPFLLLPFFQYSISLWGWRSAFLIFSFLVFAIPLPLNALFLRHRPEELGLLPDGDSPRRSSEENPRDIGQDRNGSPSPLGKERRVRDLMKTGRFWCLLLYPCLTVFGVYVIIVHQVRYLVDLGVDKMWAASLLAATGAISVGFRFFWGWFSDRMGREITFTLGGVCFSSGILFLLIFQTVPSTALLYLFVFLFGAGWGSTAPMFMSIAADLYKGRHFGLIYGMVEGGVGLGAALGTWAAGYIFDQTQGYFWAFVLCILLDLVAILIVWYVAPRKFRPSRT
jgi:MFS family permease